MLTQRKREEGDTKDKLGEIEGRLDNIKRKCYIVIALNLIRYTEGHRKRDKGSGQLLFRNQKMSDFLLPTMNS